MYMLRKDTKNMVRDNLLRRYCLPHIVPLCGDVSNRNMSRYMSAVYDKK